MKYGYACTCRTNAEHILGAQQFVARKNNVSVQENAEQDKVMGKDIEM